MKPFSKWRPSAILNFRKLLFSSRGVCLSMVLLIPNIPNTASISQNVAKIRFSIWRLSAILNFILFFINQHVTIIEPKFESAHKISSKSDDSRPRYSDITIFKMAAVRHLEFSKFGILILLLHTKFRVNRTINLGDIAKRRFSIWRLSAILNLQYFVLCHMAVLKTEICSGTPNFIEIG